MEKLNVAIADDNERMLNLLGEIVESDKDLKLQILILYLSDCV